MHRVIVGVKVVTVYQQQPLCAAATAAATCGGAFPAAKDPTEEHWPSTMPPLVAASIASNCWSPHPWIFGKWMSTCPPVDDGQKLHWDCECGVKALFSRSLCLCVGEIDRRSMAGSSLCFIISSICVHFHSMRFLSIYLRQLFSLGVFFICLDKC